MDVSSSMCCALKSWAFWLQVFTIADSVKLMTVVSSGWAWAAPPVRQTIQHGIPFLLIVAGQSVGQLPLYRGKKRIPGIYP